MLLSIRDSASLRLSLRASMWIRLSLRARVWFSVKASVQLRLSGSMLLSILSMWLELALR